MSGYIPFPTTVPEAARYLTDHYRMAVSEDKVRRVFDEIGEGLRAGPRGPRLILQEMLDRIMATIEREGYVFSGTLTAPYDPEKFAPLIADLCEASGVPPDTPLSNPQPVVYSPVDERPQERTGQQAQQPERPQPKFRGRRSTRR
jgi:hypothetical protein